MALLMCPAAGASAALFTEQLRGVKEPEEVPRTSCSATPVNVRLTQPSCLEKRLLWTLTNVLMSSRSLKRIDPQREGRCIPFRREYIPPALLSRRQYSAWAPQPSYFHFQCKPTWSDAPVRCIPNPTGPCKDLRRFPYSLSETNPQPLPYCNNEVCKRLV